MNPFDRKSMENDVKRALAEDIGPQDVSAQLLPQTLIVHAQIISREAMLVCGQPWVNEVLRQVHSDIHIAWCVNEGEWLSESAVLCDIHGPAAALLSAERTALNFLQTLAATATQTHYYVEALRHTQTRLLDTRKTLPGLRLAQKYAVVCGGGTNHRLGLYDAFLIKENHIKACGSLLKAVQKARKMRPDLWVEVEVETLLELDEALIAKPDRIMLDNFTIDMLTQAVKRTAGACPLEASGNTDLNTIAKIAATGVDYISVGNLTKSLQAIDLSLLVRECL